MGTMSVMGKEGDIIVEWDPDDKESVDRAKAEWARLKKDGYEFFKPVESRGVRLKRFDKKLGRVIAGPGVQHKSDKAVAPGRRTQTRGKAMAGGPVSRPVSVPRRRRS